MGADSTCRPIGPLQQLRRAEFDNLLHFRRQGDHAVLNAPTEAVHELDNRPIGTVCAQRQCRNFNQCAGCQTQGTVSRRYLRILSVRRFWQLRNFIHSL